MIELYNLNKDEKMLIIELLPINQVIEFLKKKKNKKIFGKQFNGVNLNSKSELLKKRIPKAFFSAIERKENTTSEFVKEVINKKLEKINEYIKLNLDSEKDIKKIIQSKQKDEYIKLVDILLETIESKYILLFLNLNGIQLKVRQKKLLEKSIEEGIEYTKIKKEVRKLEKEKLEKEYKEKFKLIKNKGQTLLKNEKGENKALSYQLSEKNEIIKEIKQKINQKNKYIDKQQINYNNLKKKLETSEYEIKNIKGNLNDIKKNWQQDLKKQIEKNEELKVINQKQNLKIKQLDNNLNEQYESYNNKYRTRWEEEHQTILDKKRELIKKIAKLNDTIKTLKNKIIDLEVKKEKTNEKLNQYNNLVTNFISNIDKELITSALKSSILNIKGLVQTKENHMELYIKKQIKSDKTEVCESINEWRSKIEHNLKNIGVRKNRSEWSDYILGILAAKTIPLIVGCKTREIAKAISYTYAGETPLIVTLPGGYSEVNELINLYHNCEANIILIEGVIGQMNESIMMPLFKEYIEEKENNKLILISCEDTSMVNLIPSYLFEYMTLIQITDIRPVAQYNYVYTDSTILLQLMRENELDINNSYKKLRKLLKHIDVIDGYIISRSLILAYICKEREIDNALACLILCDLKLMFKDNDIREKIVSNINDYDSDFIQDLKNLIVGE